MKKKFLKPPARLSKPCERKLPSLRAKSLASLTSLLSKILSEANIWKERENLCLKRSRRKKISYGLRETPDIGSNLCEIGYKRPETWTKSRNRKTFFQKNPPSRKSSARTSLSARAKRAACLKITGFL